MLKTYQLDPFVTAYLIAAMWASTIECEDMSSPAMTYLLAWLALSCIVAPLIGACIAYGTGGAE